MTSKVYGIVEGFFSSPDTIWKSNVRLRIIRYIARECPNLNVYLYCSKDDPFVRKKWQKRYPSKALLAVKKTSDLCAVNNITFIYGLNPEFCLGEVRKNFQEYAEKIFWKLGQLRSIGISSFAILYDDIPYSYSVTAKIRSKEDWEVGMFQALAVNAVGARFGKKGPILFCPSDYFFSKTTEYIRALRRYLSASINMLWTGPKIFTPKITREMVSTASSKVKNKLIWWDNYPVNDCEHRKGSFHIGGFNGPDKKVTRNLAGILMNPMREPFANLIAFRTFNEYIAARRYSRTNETRQAFEKLIGKNWKSFYRIYYSFASRSAVDSKPCGYVGKVLKIKNEMELNKIMGDIDKDIKTIQTTSPREKNLKSFLTETKSVVEKACAYRKVCDALLENKPWEEIFASIDLFPIVLGNFDYRNQIFSVLKKRLRLTQTISLLPKKEEERAYRTGEDILRKYKNKSSLTITPRDYKLFFDAVFRVIDCDVERFIRSLSRLDTIEHVKAVTMRMIINQYCSLWRKNRNSVIIKCKDTITRST